MVEGKRVVGWAILLLYKKHEQQELTISFKIRTHCPP